MLPVPAEELPVESQENAPVASPFKTALIMSVKAVPLMFGPNISGNVSAFASWTGGTNDGALIRHEGKNAGMAGGSGTAIQVEIGFNAAKSFALYGKSSFVQPASIRFLPCIKF